MKKLFLFAALAATPFAAPSVAATADTGIDRVVVSTKGLDLASEQGQRALDLRITHAASSVCGTPSAADARGWKTFERCVEAAKAGANEQRRSVALTNAGHSDVLTATR